MSNLKAELSPLIDTRHENFPGGNRHPANTWDKSEQLFDEEMMNTSELTMDDVETMYQRDLIEFARTSKFVRISGFEKIPVTFDIKNEFAWLVGRGKARIVFRNENVLMVTAGLGKSFEFMKGG